MGIFDNFVRKEQIGKYLQVEWFEYAAGLVLILGGFWRTLYLPLGSNSPMFFSNFIVAVRYYEHKYLTHRYIIMETKYIRQDVR